MKARGTRQFGVTVLAVVVLTLLPALAWMQYRWLGQLSEAESERMQRTLRTSALQFARDYDGELARAQTGLAVDGTVARDENWAAYAERYTTWFERASHPGMVKHVLLVDAPAPGDREEPTRPVDPALLRLRRWNNDARVFEPWPWPEDLDRSRRVISQQLGFLRLMRGQGPGGGFRGGSRGNISMTIAGARTLMAPVTVVEFPRDGTMPPRIDVLGFTIVELDLEEVREVVLPALARRHFQSDGIPAYRMAVVDRERAADVVWESEPGAAKLVQASPDVTQDFAAPRPEQIIVVSRDQASHVATGPPPPPPAPPPAPPAPTATMNLPVPPPTTESIFLSMVENRTGGAAGRMVRAGAGSPDGRWRLVAQHRAGSLEAAVAAARSRNLLISSSVLVLLTMAIGLIVVSARRAQTLARQQMEFVAAVSHELRTPVSVIGTAAGNLADGVVADPARVKKYGETIRGESRRLAETVERVLLLAGIESGRAAAARVPVSPAEVVHDALEACRPQIDAAGATVETDVAADLPPVNGDRSALRSALQNLVSNAVKYGGDARWVRVSAKLRTSSGYVVRERRFGARAFEQPAVDFIVEDRGPGISAEDRAHIFEPFYRGRDAVAQQIQGSGLGLNLVQRIAEAHHGHIAVVSEPGKGSTFTLTLPAAIDAAAMAHAAAAEATS